MLYVSDVCFVLAVCAFISYGLSLAEAIRRAKRDRTQLDKIGTHARVSGILAAMILLPLFLFFVGCGIAAYAK